MEKTEQLFSSTLDELSAMGKRLEAVAAVETEFDVKIEALNERIDALFECQKSIVDDLTHLSAAIGDLKSALDGTASLQSRIHELQERLGELDVQGLGAKLDEASGEISKATNKLLSAEKRQKEAEQKKNLGKK